MKHYQLLEYRQKIGEIKELKLQVPYELIPKYKMNDKTIRKTQYIADFTYVSTKDNKLHVVDTKGFKTDVYRLKKKIFEYKYGIEIEEV
jgi:DNA polymerase III sliding clamp (beta) subunit (PCNA family)